MCSMQPKPPPWSLILFVVWAAEKNMVCDDHFSLLNRLSYPLSECFPVRHPRNQWTSQILGDVRQWYVHWNWLTKCLISHYTGAADKNAQALAFVGKGITFDSGGISLKPGAVCLFSPSCHAVNLFRFITGHEADAWRHGCVSEQQKVWLHLHLLITYQVELQLSFRLHGLLLNLSSRTYFPSIV